MRTKPRYIVVTGPESCGKTTLAMALARELRLPVVPEFARTYLDGLGRNYTGLDLPIIASGQVNSEKEVMKEGAVAVVCDTDVLTIRIWHEFKYGRPSEQINDLMPEQSDRFYLLCTPDLPWQPDPQRENPEDREELFRWHTELLERLGARYAIVRGSGPARSGSALAALRAGGWPQ